MITSRVFTSWTTAPASRARRRVRTSASLKLYTNPASRGRIVEWYVGSWKARTVTPGKFTLAAIYNPLTHFYVFSPVDRCRCEAEHATAHGWGRAIVRRLAAPLIILNLAVAGAWQTTYVATSTQDICNAVSLTGT